MVTFFKALREFALIVFGALVGILLGLCAAHVLPPYLDLSFP